MNKKNDFYKMPAGLRLLAVFSALSLLVLSACNKEVDDDFGAGTANNKTAIPTICPDPADPIPSGTPVHLATTTEDASIWYTTDGSEPAVDNCKQYSSQIIIEGEDGEVITVKAIAVKSGFADSPIAEFAYTIAGESGTSEISGEQEEQEEPLILRSVIDVSKVSTGEGFTLDGNVYKINDDGNYTVTGDNEITGYTVAVEAADTNILLEDVTIGGDKPFLVKSGAQAAILISGSNVLWTGSYSYAPLNVPAGASIIIDSSGSRNAGNPLQSSHALAGTLSVELAGDGEATECAAIGANKDENCGNITILGAAVMVKGWTSNKVEGAAIGGSKKRPSGAVTIAGGIVVAAGDEGATVGSGRLDSQTYTLYNTVTLTVTGGFLAAFKMGNGTKTGAAIGSGAAAAPASAADGGTVTITGGTVAAITGGSHSGSFSYAIGPSHEGNVIVTGDPSNTENSDFDKAVLFATDIYANKMPDASDTGVLIGNDKFIFTPPTWNSADHVYSGGVITLNTDYTVPQGGALIIPKGWTLNLKSHTLGNNGTICYDSTDSVSVPGQKVDSPDYGVIVNQ